MASGLRNRLKALGAISTPKVPTHKGGLMTFARRYDLPEGIFDLSPVGLRRIGWTDGRFDVTRCLFLDTETTGLSGGAGTVAFLVGLGYIGGAGIEGERPYFMVEQYFMRDYADEPELLDRLAATAEHFESACTFNGQRFDLPLLETRYTMNRMRTRWRDLSGLDLLYPARRTWKLRLGSCKLGRLEEYILGRAREGDIPGSEVPQRWFNYLKCGDMSLVDDILEHNRLDIVTLAYLLTHLCALYSEPEKTEEREDLFSMGKALEAQGEIKPARELYRLAALPLRATTLHALRSERVCGMANYRHVLLLRKQKDYESMREILTYMLRKQQMPFEANIEMAKICEHRDRNPGAALRYARNALAFCPDEQIAALKKRIDRLEQKTGVNQHGTI